jgi:hypothetical protein
MAEKLWWSQSIEGLFVRGIGKDMTPELRAKLKDLGIDLSAQQMVITSEGTEECTFTITWDE